VKITERGTVLAMLLQWIHRVNVLAVFIVLAAAHGILYYSLGNDDWITLALLAALVETGVLAVIRSLFRVKGKESDE